MAHTCTLLLNKKAPIRKIYAKSFKFVFSFNIQSILPEQ